MLFVGLYHLIIGLLSLGDLPRLKIRIWSPSDISSTSSARPARKAARRCSTNAFNKPRAPCKLFWLCYAAMWDYQQAARRL